MNGTLKTTTDKYAFIRGADQRDYFFLPAALDPAGPQFHELRVGMAMDFDGVTNYIDPRTGASRGARATAVRVVASHVSA